MSQPSPARVKLIFDALRRLPPGRRAAELERACSDDATVRRQVQELLADLDSAGEFLRNPTFPAPHAGAAAAGTDATSPTATIPAAPGLRVGPYTILEHIGEGGFGTVYLAEQHDPVRRRVALKIIKPGMDTRQVIARFEAERQALAMMDHPHIARVLDAGATDSGRPYFVMELVKGVPITEHCDRNKVSLRERLALFTDVCRAVQHAHQKGIIHRDLKPSNVLVSRQDDRPVAKVIDFGVVKTTGGRLTEATIHTEWRQLVGTPAYMSPEQAGLSDLDIDTRSDIYSLGVLLYELLTGTTPFDAARLRRADLDELRRIIREVEPPRPSERVSALTRPAAVRSGGGLSPPSLLRAPFVSAPVRVLRGELDWIVMKCLEKDRARRYATANDLAADVQRYLSAEPVVAAPPRRLYRLRKTLRRHGGLLAAASAFLGLLAGSAVVATALWQRAEREAAQAWTERDKAERIADFMESMFTGVRPLVAAGRDTQLLAALMDGAAQRIRAGELAKAPEAELRLRLAIGGVYSDIAAYAPAHEMLAPAPELARQLGPAAEARALHARGLVYLAERREADALPWFEGALRIRRKLHPGDHAELADSLANVGACLGHTDRKDEASALFDEALAISRRLHPDDHWRVARDLADVAWIAANRGRPADALPIYESALAMRRRLARDAADLSVAHTMEHLALLCYCPLGRAVDALPLLCEVLAVRQELLGHDHPTAFGTRTHIAFCLLMLDRPCEAADHLCDTYARYEQIFDPPNRHMRHCGVLLVEALRRCGRLAEAEHAARRQIQLDLARSGSIDMLGIDSQWQLAHVLLTAGCAEEALLCLRRAAELAESDPLALTSFLQMQVQVLLHENVDDEAEVERIAREALEICERELPAGHPRYWLRHYATWLLGAALSVQGRYAEAEPLLLAGYESLDPQGLPPAAGVGFDMKSAALVRIVELYERWHAAEPNAGHDRKALEHRATLETSDAARWRIGETRAPPQSGF